MLTLKATPRAILKGIRDESTRQLPVEAINLPQHLPVFFLMTQKASTVNIVGGNAAQQIYGSDTFDPNSDFFNHQTVGANTALSAANQIMVVPVKMPDAKAASIRLAAEVVATTIDGAHKTRVIWHAMPIDEQDEQSFGKAVMNAKHRDGTTTSELTNDKLGVLVDPADPDNKEYFVPSALIPIMDLQVETVGSYGNQYAIAIDAPIETDELPTDVALAEHLKSFIYRLNILHKTTPTASPTYVYNNYSEVGTDFVLKPNTVNKSTNVALSLDKVLKDFYQDVESTDKPPVYGPFPKLHIYNSNVEALAKMLAKEYTVEAVAEDSSKKPFVIPGIYDTEEEALERAYMVNIFTGHDVFGKAYENCDFASSRKFGGIRLGKQSIVYAQGGDDGFPKLLGVTDTVKLLQTYDETVRAWCDNFNDTNPLFDSAKYPFSTIWDTGFSMETKKSLLKPVGQHKRIWTVLSTHAVADYADTTAQTGWYIKPALTGAEEVSVGMLLKTHALLLPESEEFGTPTVRVGIVSRSGELIDNTYRGRLPLTIELIRKVSEYCGAGDAIWEPTKAFDVWPNNIVNMFKNINVTYQSNAVYNKSWDAGIMWVQNADTQRAFFPAFRTVYPNDTSVLTSLINMIACSYLERICELVWRRLVGNGKLTDDEFIERSNEMIAQEVHGKFDGRYRIEPHTYYTSADKLLGYSWSVDINFYANNMKTVGSFTIVARRMADYAPSANRI